MTNQYLQKEINKKNHIKQYLKVNDIEGLIIINPDNRFWYTNFSSTAGYLVITKNYTILYLDGRYITAGTSQAKNVDKIKEIPTNSFQSFLQILKQDLIKQKVKTLGFDKNYFSYNDYEQFNQICEIFKPVNLNEIRAIKTNEEVADIKKACEISEKSLSQVIPQIKPGVTEKEIADLLLSTMLKNGAEKNGFDTIVASGMRSALPHGQASSKVIENNEVITIDFGCYYKGMCSDITRTIAIGDVDPEIQKIFKIVLEAQEKGVAAIKPGISSSMIDKVCRDHITSAGYGKFFVHSTGHGLGIDVHEFPRVSKYADVILQPGMVITVEPGIYIPGLGGIRIEDDVLVTDTGYQLLNNFPKSENSKLIKLQS